MNKREILVKHDSQLVGSKSQILENEKNKYMKSDTGNQPAFTKFTGGVDNISIFCPTYQPTMMERIMSSTKTGSPQA